jgi:prepilin-type N-terminal cleavage/methylation domain-containing protein
MMLKLEGIPKVQTHPAGALRLLELPSNSRAGQLPSEKSLNLGNRRKKQKGFSLLEILVVVTIIALITTVLAFSLSALPKMRLKESSRKFQGAVVFIANKARTTHMFYRIVLDMDSENPTLVVQVLPPNSKPPDSDPEILEEEKDEDSIFENWPRLDLDDPVGALGMDDNGKPFRPPLEKWESPKTKLSKKVKLKGIRIKSVVFPCINKEYDSGKVGIVFTPRGTNLGVVVHLKSAGNAESTIIISPLTSDVQYFSGFETPENLCFDAEKNRLKHDMED